MPTLSFQNITVSVPDVKGPKRYLPSACVRNQNRKEVLHNVSGRFPNKGIVAIMGPSGSGKTTFLNAVSNRMAIGGSSGVKCSGAVRVDGQVVEPEFFYSKSVSFVPQDTCLFAELTPREAIRFSTTLIFPTLNPEAVETRVTKTIAAMGLQKCADTQVGNEMFRGVSGGERKRTSIGVNIVNEPSVLFLDEPTTGLDTETAAHVVRSIQNLSTPVDATVSSSSASSSSSSSLAASAASSTADPAPGSAGDEGRIIIMTLHQPSSEIWDMIDHLVILAQGYIVYNGPAKDAMDFFVSIGFRRPLHVNPADFFLDIVQCEEDDGSDDAHPPAPAAAAASSGGLPTRTPGTARPRLSVPMPPDPAAAAAAAAAANPSAAVVARTRSNKKQRAKFLATAWRHHERLLMLARRGSAPAPPAAAVASALANGAGASVASALGWSQPSAGSVSAAAASSSAAGADAAPMSAAETAAALRRAKLAEVMRRYNERMQQQQPNDDGCDALGSDVEDGAADDDFHAYSSSALSFAPDRSGYGSGSGAGGGSLEGRDKWVHELKALVSRSWKTFVRTRLMIPMKLVQIVVTAILIIGLFAPLGSDQVSVLNRTGAFYLVIIVQIFATVLSVVMLFPAERGVYLNEQAQRLYSVSSYYVSKLIIDLPILTGTIFGFCLLVYFAVGFQASFDRFMRFFCVLEAVAVCGHAMGLIVASCVASPAMAALLAPMAIAPFILFSHIAIPGDPESRILGILRPVQVFSPFWWGLDALAVTEFSGLRLHCGDDEVYAVPSVEHGLLYLCRFMLGEEVLQMYSISQSAYAPALIYLMLIALFNLAVSGILLKVLSLRVAKCVPMEPPSASAAHAGLPPLPRLAAVPRESGL